MPAGTLHRAKNQKNDEFYTQFDDIQQEVNSYVIFNPDVFRDKTILLPCDDPEWSNFTKFFALNFERYGIKKLISTSYANCKKSATLVQLSLFEEENPKFDEKKTDTHGKIFVLDRDSDKSGRIDINDLQWDYLDGDGDFRSEEVTKLRDEADIIITNPPFSLLREFINWIIEGNKKFLIIGNLKAITDKSIFQLFYEGKMWLGSTRFKSGATYFMGSKDLYDPSKISNSKYAYIKDDILYWRVNGVRWYTNLDHGHRHEQLKLMTWDDNVKYSRHPEVKGIGYIKYDNYDVINIPWVDAIPSDYDGIMGVPTSFFDKYNPDQFEILGCTQRGCHNAVPDTKKYDDYVEMRQNGLRTGSSGGKTNENANMEKNDGKHNYFINRDGHVVQSLDSRIFIRFRRK